MADPIYLSNGVTFDPTIGNNPDAETQTSTWDYMKSSAADSFGQTRDAITGDILGLFDPGQRITGTEANLKYGYKGPSPEYDVKFDPDQTYTTAEVALMQKTMQQKQQSDFIAATRPQTWATYGAGAVAGAAGFMANPENDVFFMMPSGRAITLAGGMLEDAGLVGAAARSQALAASMKTTALGRMGISAIDNAAGTALMQPLILGGAQQENQDYSFTDAAANVLYGAVGGAVFHGLGEIAGATWRGSMRMGLNGVDSGLATPDLNEMLFKADRGQVIRDLTEQNGTPPTEAQVQAEIGTRYAAVVKAAADKAAEEPRPDIELDAKVPDQIASLAQDGKFDEAADAMEQHTSALENEKTFGLTDEDKATANEPIATFEKIKSAIAEFTDCVTNQAGGGELT